MTRPRPVNLRALHTCVQGATRHFVTGLRPTLDPAAPAPSQAVIAARDHLKGVSTLPGDCHALPKAS
jgi:hypothetical protein